MPRENPFYYNLPTSPEDFVGRWSLVHEIVTDLCRPHPDSWAVIGGRRFGKSSVLKTVESGLSARLAGCEWGDRYVIPLIVDLKRCGMESERSVYACIVRQLRRALRTNHGLALDLSKTLLQTIAARREEALSFYQFEDALDDLATHVEEQLGPLRLVLLLDEVEGTTHFPWSETLFNQMRALIYDGPLANVVRLVLTGSAQVTRVRHAGSPLLNAVKIVHLEPLSEADLQDLIVRGGEVTEGVSSAVQVQSGGHPFIAQYLLHHLWGDGLTQATPTQVERIARQMRQRRNADLQGWWEAIGDSGRRAYEVLVTVGDWLPERALLVEVQDTAQPLSQGLAALCYHGLVVRDESGQLFRTVGRLFGDWFDLNVVERSLGFKGGCAMNRKQDLERSIRESYKLVHEYEDIARLSDNPKEKARARRAIEEQQELIQGYLVEYVPLCERLGLAIPESVAEIAVTAGVSLRSAPLPQPPLDSPSALPIVASKGSLINTHALLIGVGDYAHPRYGSLPATVRDAQAIAAVLTDPARGGYPPGNVQVITGPDANIVNIRAVLKSLAESTDSQSIAFVYFSGHGGRALEDGTWRAYLCPREADPDDLAHTAIPGDEFSALLTAIPARRLLVMLDACHAAGSAELKAADGTPVWKSGLPDDYYEALSQGSGRVVIASSKEDQSSYVRPQGDLSLFTHHLREALGGKAAVRSDGLIHVLDVFHYVNEAVQADEPRQVPTLKVKDLDLNFPIALDRGGKRAGPAPAIPGVGDIREQIVRDPIAGAKALSDYLAARPDWAAKCNEVDLKRADLERIQHDLDLFGPNPSDQAAKNRAVYFLLRVCLELERPDQ